MFTPYKQVRIVVTTVFETNRLNTGVFPAAGKSPPASKMKPGAYGFIIYSSNFLNTNEPLVPPNPKELESTYFTSLLSPLLGV